MASCASIADILSWSSSPEIVEGWGDLGVCQIFTTIKKYFNQISNIYTSTSNFNKSIKFILSYVVCFHHCYPNTNLIQGFDFLKFQFQQVWPAFHLICFPKTELKSLLIKRFFYFIDLSELIVLYHLQLMSIDMPEKLPFDKQIGDPIDKSSLRQYCRREFPRVY